MIGEILGITNKLLAHWTPEKIKARARLKLKKLEKERNALLKKPATPATCDRLQRLLANITSLQNYLKEN